ncbi:MAG: ATP-binding protein [Oscillospiraceae bacterium]|nr:ATP-binding protein [Oscillospiraceae bacterium]
MAYPYRIYEKAAETLKERKRKASGEAERRRNEFCLTRPEYPLLEKALADTAAGLIAAMGIKDRDAAERQIYKIKNDNLEAQLSIKKLLRSAGLPENHLEIKYACPVCKDSGIKQDGRLCKCHLELLKKIAYEELCRHSALKLSTFDDLELSYYPDAKDGDGISPRKRMAEIIGYCKIYAEEFSRDSMSLFMYGATGLGKTHLSLAIANKVIEKGYGVIYGSAGNLLSALEREHFGKGQKDADYTEDALLECDLLIFDDLGSEFSTQFTVSKVYNIINTRGLNQLPTIINTNLTISDLIDKYTTRVTSRIIGEYQGLMFHGEDIRQVRG